MVEQDHLERREQMVEAAEVLARSGVMSHTGHINFSSRLDDSRMLLTSSGLIDELSAERLAVVRLDGEVEEGEITHSTGHIVGMHVAVYRGREDAHAVLHTHSPHITAFALAQRPLSCRYEPLLRRGQREEVPVIPWAPRGSESFLQGIADTAASRADTSAVLLANHGVLAFASSPMAVVKLLITLEEAARAELHAVALGGAKDFTTAEVAQAGPS